MFDMQGKPEQSWGSLFQQEMVCPVIATLFVDANFHY